MTVQSAPQAVTRRMLLARLIGGFSFVPALVLALALLTVVVITQPQTSWLQMLLYFSPFALVAIASGMAPLAGGGGVDLSLSASMTLCCAVYVVVLAPAGLGGLESIPLVLAVGAGVGLINGLIVTLLRVSPLIATLSMNFILIGLCVKIAPRPALVREGWIYELGQGSWGLPAGLVLIAAPLILWMLLRATPFVRVLLATGSNDAAAYASGISVDLVRVLAYALGGLVAGVGGFALVAVSGSIDASTAQSYLIPGLVAIALGGTALEGGRGGVVGPLAGMAFLFLLQLSLSSVGVGQSWIQIIYGVALVGAIVFSRQLSVAGRGRP